MRIGILTSGGDCPGINATIRGVCKTAINHYGMEVIGIHSGFQGLLTKDVESFTEKVLIWFAELGKYDARYFAAKAFLRRTA